MEKHYNIHSIPTVKSLGDRLKNVYPNVDENTPLPCAWNPEEKCCDIELSENNLRVNFKGHRQIFNCAAAIRTLHSIPPDCGLYYFEVKIISIAEDGYVGIGLTSKTLFRMNRLPGWDRKSYGYHGHDGNSFVSSGSGESYGPTFSTGDVIGCGVSLVNNTCFFTKNGVDLGIAFKDMPSTLYPTVGFQNPAEVIANFGQESFEFHRIEDMIKQM